MPYLIKVTDHFSAAHALSGYNGNCANLHGHTWEVTAEIAETELDELGISTDFRDLKAALADILSEYDHAVLINDKDKSKYSEIEFVNVFEVNPTAEVLAEDIYNQFKYLGYKINSVVVCEGNSSSVTYYE